ncbi:MAG: hypothetical protein Q4G40_12035 [Brachybacterium sp.]|nr:hypothetical protein [Brachybacterium sp.]
MNTITPTTTTQHDGYTITAMGTVQIGRTSYSVQIMHVAGYAPDYQLVGPRGALYTLVETNRPGVYDVIGIMSGPMRRKGNQVRLALIGDLIEQV